MARQFHVFDADNRFLHYLKKDDGLRLIEGSRPAADLIAPWKIRLRPTPEFLLSKLPPRVFIPEQPETSTLSCAEIPGLRFVEPGGKIPPASVRLRRFARAERWAALLWAERQLERTHSLNA